MELCALNLNDFIRDGLTLKIGLTQYFHPGSVNSEMGCFTLYNIIHDIVYGLQFIQSKGEMHRDLKPHNGDLYTS
jgi:serine/threonine protein kinase